jgi:biotin-dependent carboxylase-like uncharacterized protein
MAEPHGRRIEIRDAGALSTVQDLGRPGQAHLGVPRSGALDEPAHRLANRLVGNEESAATVECLGGGLTFVCRSALTVAVTGAGVPVTVDGRQREWGNALPVPAGAVVALGSPTRGLRSYLAVSGGIDVPRVLGSRSADLLSGLGPAPLAEGDVLPVGAAPTAAVAVESVHPPLARTELRLRLGPRDGWFAFESVAAISGAAYTVGSSSNRIGLRLEGEPIRWRRDEELSSEGMVLGAVQVPPNGHPVVFLNDHPTTGGYPVLGVVVAEDLPVCAQLRPGDRVTLRVV